MEEGPRRTTTRIAALKAGAWDARMRHQLDEDLLPDDCPLGGISASRVWEGLRELQYTYQERETGWQAVPAEFERLARAFHSLVAIGA